MIHQFISDHGRQLLAIARRLVGRTHAEDVAQDAFVKLAQRLEQCPPPEVMALLRSPTDLRKLMCRITACRAYEHLRHRENRAHAPADGGAAFEAIDVERVERAYARLSPTQRIAHVLHHYYGFTDKDFELTLGISRSHGQTLARCAHRALRHALELETRS